MIKNIKEFVTPQNKGNAYTKITMGVLVTPSEIVATDTYKLIEVKIKNDVEKPIVIKLPKGIKSIHSVNKDIAYENGRGDTFFVEKMEGEYPQYKTIFNRLENKKKITIRVSASHLEAIAKAFTVTGEYPEHVDMDIYPDNEYNAIKFTRDNITALLMPIIK